MGSTGHLRFSASLARSREDDHRNSSCDALPGDIHAAACSGHSGRQQCREFGLTTRVPRGSNGAAMPRRRSLKSNLATKSPHRSIKSNRDAHADIVLAYGLLPEEVGGDDSILTLVDVRAAQRVLLAARCGTWGEYASLAGLTWKQATQDFGEWLADLNDGVLPKPGTEFHYDQIYGATLLMGDAAYWIARWVPDPRDVAVDVLEGLGKRARPALTIPGLEVESDSPDGHVGSISASDAAVFDRMREALRLAGFSNVTITRDDALVRQCIVLCLIIPGSGSKRSREAGPATRGGHQCRSSCTPARAPTEKGPSRLLFKSNLSIGSLFTRFEKHGALEQAHDRPAACAPPAAASHLAATQPAEFAARFDAVVGSGKRAPGPPP